MTDLEATLSPAPPDVLRAYHQFAAAIASLDSGTLDTLSGAFDALRRRHRQAVAVTGQAAVDLAYDLGRIDAKEVDDDQDPDPGTVIGLDPRYAAVSDLIDTGVPGLVYVGLAILVYDQLRPADLEAITGWWAAAGGYVPTMLNPPGRNTRVNLEQPTDDAGEQPAPAAAGRRRVDPPPQGREPVARPVRVHGRRRGLLFILGLLTFWLPVTCLGMLGFAFFHASLGDGTSGVYLVLAAIAAAGTIVAAASRRYIRAKAR